MSDSNPILIELMAKDSASGQIVKVTTTLNDMKKSAAAAGIAISVSAKKTDTDYANAIKKVDAGGRQAMIGLRSLAQAAELAGGDKGLQAIATEAAVTADVVGDVAGAFMTLNPLVLGMAAGAAVISLVVAQMRQAEEAAQKVAEPFVKIREEINALAALKGIDVLAKQLGVSSEALGAYVKGAEKGWQTTTLLNESTRILAENEAKLKKEENNLAEATRWLSENRDAARATDDQTIATYGEMSAKVYTARQAIEVLTGAIAANKKQIADAGDATKKGASAFAEQSRVVDLLKTNIPAAAKEIQSYTTAINKLNADHRKAVAGFADDILTADRKANGDRVKAAADTAQRIGDIEANKAQRIGDINADTASRVGDIYRDLATRLSDAAEDAAERKAEDERDWLLKAKGYAQDREKIERDLADELSGISRDAAEEEQNKPWSEVMKIRRQAAARQQDAVKKAGEQRTELQAEQTAALEEFNYRQSLADRESVQNAQRARRDADRQAAEARESADKAIAEAQRVAEQNIADARRAEREKIAAINERVNEEKASIQKRAAEESAAYALSKAEATTAHNARMKELFDTRTETQRLAADWLIVKGNVDAATASLVNQSGVIASMNTPSSGSSSYIQQWNQGYRPAGWYAEGGDFIVRRPTVIGVGEGSQPERVTITPLGGNHQGGARPVVFQNCNFRNVQDVYDALERADRGL